MLRTRVIPCLLLKNESLVKTVKFKEYNYIGDPVNTVRIFNELEVDELMFLDIFASKENRNINFKILTDIANECFMPLSYGGNIKSLDDAKKIFEIGFEKVVINSNAFNNIKLIEEISKYFGNQSVVGSIDIKKSFFGSQKIYSHHGKYKQSIEVLEWVKELEKAGVGELLVTSIDKEGTWDGYDLDLIESITSNVQIPVVANGGCGKIEHLGEVVKKAKASACAVGSMVVYQKKDMGVLVNFPDRKNLEKYLN
ncbi:glycosyl amidation-associated protein WbuZ [Malaciobacter marinus]|uniref:imidazole glycerol-phosphate synthase n=1 Tax=Malaciobacter marinus TaxID=505249 RepID=A0A347TJ62_9BACT|nr:AglZ/HisF2 family acetamidino modification protein [Malaciobacter marinus]AXX86640.1 glycosyl amidation-associated protein WbuZ [Malaciobacter marinus]PHO14685.1 imidazole glycerol phosphate synthase subunit HisF [Malaciobacter marinus]